jgi:hypothetical protein
MMLLVLAVMGVMVLVVTVSPPNPGVDRGGRGAATETPQSASVSDPNAFDVTATLSTDDADQMIEAELGDRVEIVVNGRAPDSVALGDMRIEALDDVAPARFQFLAEFTGTYPLVLVSENRRIGSLEIR